MNYYSVLRDELPGNFEYFERGARNWPYHNGFFTELKRALSDFKKFRERLIEKDIRLVQTSTSLSFSTTIRDGFFIRYSKKKGIKAIVFFRGWDAAAEAKVKNYFYIFKFFFFKADKIITLSESSKTTLKNWGYKKEIIVETTLVNRDLLINISEEYIQDKFRKIKEERTINLLFLSRIEARKGIFELIEAFRILSENPGNSFRYILTICGDGLEMEKMLDWLKVLKLENIVIKGFIDGLQKREAFENAQLFVFPSHGEGMPNAVLEAMGFGLPVLTTPVGGITDFFIPGKHGNFIKVNSPRDIADKIIFLTMNLDLLCEMSLNNYNLANEKFRSDRVAERIQKIFNNV